MVSTLWHWHVSFRGKSTGKLLVSRENAGEHLRQPVFDLFSLVAWPVATEGFSQERCGTRHPSVSPSSSRTVTESEPRQHAPGECGRRYPQSPDRVETAEHERPYR